MGDNGNWFVGSDDTGKPSRGEKGEPGSPGAKGDKGDPGATPNLTIGSVTTLEAGQSATASMGGTAESPVLNLGIPRGAKGEPGEGGGGTDISLGLTSAAVGQIIKVKAVDNSGKPTAWEAVESGSAEDAVLYTEQNLTNAQREQARANINAVGNEAIEFFNSEFKTHSEICKAYESGKVCYYPYAGTKLMSNAYSGRMQPFVFSGTNGNNEFLTVTVNTDNSVVPGDSGIYNLTEVPQATAEAIGGVKADSVEADDTQPVRIGGDGKLYTAAGGTDISLGLTSASVGQTIKVKAIDESGKPTAWEAADMSEGGETWEKISDVSLTQDVSRYILASFGTYRKIKIMMERDAYVSGLSKNVWVRISSPSSNNFYTVGYFTSEYGYLKWEVNAEVNNAFISGHMISSNNPNASATSSWKVSKELGDTAVSDLSLRLDFTDVSVIQDGDSVSVWGVRW